MIFFSKQVAAGESESISADWPVTSRKADWNLGGVQTTCLKFNIAPLKLWLKNYPCGKVSFQELY